MIVVDSSAVVDALTMAPGSERLRSRMSDEELHAPHLIDVEFVSVLRGLVLGGELSLARAEDALTDFEDLPIYRWPATDAIRRRAFALRHNLSSYDATYFALAERLECPLVTRDGRLARAAGQVEWVEVL